MSDFVDAADPDAVAEVLRRALPAVGLDGLLAQLGAVPGLAVRPGRSRGLLRAAVPARVSQGDRTLECGPDGVVLLHVVGGIVLARDAVAPAELPGVLGSLVSRAAADPASGEDASVRLTALRDAVELS